MASSALDDEDLSISLPRDDDHRSRPDLHPHAHAHHTPSPASSNGRQSSAIARAGAGADPRSGHGPPGSRRGLAPGSASTHSPATQRDQHRLEQYQTIKGLGEGSFGKVKLAVHRASGRQVALKIISRRKLSSRDMVGRVEREIQYLQLLRHPHIIKL